MSISMWIGWAILCIIQNFAFTFVSRARNSGSLKRHIVAGLASNGVWFIGQIFAFSAIMKIITGAFGIPAAIFAGMFYTFFTLAGSVLAHYYSLKTEKGKSAVGASAKYAQITKEEWELVWATCSPRRVVEKAAADPNSYYRPNTFSTFDPLGDIAKKNLADKFGVTERQYSSLGNPVPTEEFRTADNPVPPVPGQGSKL